MQVQKFTHGNPFIYLKKIIGLSEKHNEYKIQDSFFSKTFPQNTFLPNKKLVSYT
jgi:hypothetical protein